MGGKKEDDRSFSLGIWVIVSIAVVTSLWALFWSPPEEPGLLVWTFTRHLIPVYQPIIDEQNAEAADNPELMRVRLDVLQPDALVQRSLTGFWAGTPVADIIQVEIKWIGQFLTGPVEEVGFVDLTDIMKREGMFDTISPASFAPWSSQGRVFGIPMGSHPVQLAYRSDIVEEAGIDVSQIRSWDDFERVMRPLVQDLDGDGQPDRYPINFWITQTPSIELLMLQAGGGAFKRDPVTGHDRLNVNAGENAQVLARVVSWCVGPARIAIDSPELTPGGNQMRLEGKVVCVFMPDWLAGIWRMDLQPLSGKVRVMPLPEWEPGGLRASVWGGTMTAIPKSTPNFEAAWDFAKKMTYQPEAAEAGFREHFAIGAISSLWDQPFYHEPVEYFGGQRAGSVYIEAARNLPLNNSSPYNQLAIERIGTAALALQRYAESNRKYRREELVPEAQRLLDAAHDEVAEIMARNVFLKEAGAS